MPDVKGSKEGSAAIMKIQRYPYADSVGNYRSDLMRNFNNKFSGNTLPLLCILNVLKDYT